MNDTVLLMKDVNQSTGKSLLIDKVTEVCRQRGGACVSQHAKNVNDKVELRCAEGHAWAAAIRHVLNSGSWCPRCAGKVLTLEDVSRAAVAKGGHLLSTEYTTSKAKYAFRCSEGHEFVALAGNVARGHWCMRCSARERGLKQRTSLDDIPAIVSSQHGRILTEACETKEMDISTTGESHETQATLSYLSALHSTSPLRLRCNKGHFWTTTAKRLRKGQWCRSCSGRAATAHKLVGLSSCNEAAVRKGGVCLSNEYENSGALLQWRCSEGHEWAACWDSVKADQWCPICSRREAGLKRRRSITDAVDFARAREGELLSSSMDSVHQPLRWRCKAGHEWESPFLGMEKTGRWCAGCAGNRKKTLQDMQRAAAERGGICRSTSYVNNHTPLEWQCQQGHTWMASPGSIQAGSWCAVCAGYKKWTVDDCKGLAAERGGDFLADRFVSVSTKYGWKCRNGHQWDAVLSSVAMGTWCPTCASGFGERLCRAHFEAIFATPFPNVRPAWLVGPNGRPLELDGYSEQLKIAFEHQGRQHYSEETVYHDDSASLALRLAYDAKKREVCREHGVTLIEVPEVGKFTKATDLRTFILAQLAQSGVVIPAGAERDQIAIYDVHAMSDEDAYQALVAHAASRDGRIVTPRYLGGQKKHEFECQQGHRWKASATQIFAKRTWCGRCAGKAPLTLDDLKETARALGGTCLSKEYTTGRLKLTWQCADGHVWGASGENVRQGKWCPRCAAIRNGVRGKKGIEHCRALAIGYGGKCESTEYVGVKTPLAWMCSLNHSWEASLDVMQRRVLKKTFCLQCLERSSSVSAQSVKK